MLIPNHMSTGFTSCWDHNQPLSSKSPLMRSPRNDQCSCLGSQSLFQRTKQFLLLLLLRVFFSKTPLYNESGRIHLLQRTGGGGLKSCKTKNLRGVSYFFRFVIESYFPFTIINLHQFQFCLNCVDIRH